MLTQDNTAAERIATLAREMEEALLHEHVDRFHELSRQRSRDLHTLLDRRHAARGDRAGGDTVEASLIESVLKRAVQDNQHLLLVARQRLGDMRRKIDLLLEKKTAHRQLGQRYRKMAGSGHLFSYRG